MVVGARLLETTLRFSLCVFLLVASAYSNNVFAVTGEASAYSDNVFTFTGEASAYSHRVLTFTGEASATMEGAGARHLVKPDKLSAIDKDAQATFGDWKFKSMNFLAALDPDFERELLEAESQQAVPSLATLDEETRKRATYLFSMLASWLQGGDLVSMRTQADRNGYESWRRLNAKYSPNLASSNLVLLTEIMSGYGLNTDSSFGSYDTFGHLEDKKARV
jgi:hypothetical protein